MNNTKDTLGPKELYDLKKQEKNKAKTIQKKTEKIKEVPKRLLKPLVYIVVIIAIIGYIGYLIAQAPSLPTDSSQGHIEKNPESHILTEKMPEPIQKHMIEHADGKNAPSILMQYNCKDYTCEDDFVEKLSGIVEQYPDNVYLAPNTYDGKLILTAEGRRQVLDTYDADIIKSFIEGK